ncbi:MAG: hypothetical protein EA379_01580 [Phycisphaerales bacterium]|nr:MAG: hypothetical protein EA379_01580 [Phycisphaerales bacterium]
MSTLNGEARRPGAPALVCMEHVLPQDVEWLWPGRIPRGKLTIIAGDPGLGKSYVVLDVIARVTRGALWPDQTRHDPRPWQRPTPGSALILTCEDGLGDTIRPRLDALGADVSKVVAMEGVHTGTDKIAHFTLDDVSPLRRAIESVPGCAVVMIDALSGFFGKTDSHNNVEVRAVLAELADLAEESYTAIIGVSHLSKSGSHARKSAHAVMGSLAFVAAPRAVWAIGADPDDPARRIMASVKMNVARPAPSWAYRIDDAGLHWEPTACDMECDQMLNGGQRGDDDRLTPAVKEAVSFLASELADGPVGAKEIQKRAREAGHSGATLQRAKERAGVVSLKTGMDGGWEWHWPGAEMFKNGAIDGD